ncbi:MAG: cellulose biosynthesis protein BcsG [Nitrospinae bacterium]|nr:cellulose biosynthesis protein BcsG [Nitrospinota bacterium]
MELWSFYFFAKLFLYYKEYIKFDVTYNLLFALFLTIPIPEKIRFRGVIVTGRVALGIILAISLLWHDSWLPPPTEGASFLMSQGIPSTEYIYSFLMRFYNPKVFMLIGAIFSFCWLANKFLKMSTLVLICIMSLIPLKVFGEPNSQELTQTVDAFFDSETTRVTRYEKPEAGHPDFDLVILHVCSLAWADMVDVGMDKDPFFRQFNYLFTNFNTVTTYSGPSVIRLLRGNCGQQRHGDIYSEAPRECYILETFSDVGFKNYVTLNHDGKYGSFAEEITNNHGRPGPMNLAGLPVQQNMFDNSPIYDDYFTLSRWWENRLVSGEKAAAVYYNTVTLHDGSHWVGQKEWWKGDRKAQYQEFLTKLFKDVTRFINLLSSSGRNVVVVFVPEHGMALKGSVIQAPGLRDIPLPPITNTPVAIKLIGKQFNGEKVHQQVIDAPTSYLAITNIISRFVEKSPFTPEGMPGKTFTHTIPQTDYVAENQSAMVVKSEMKHFFFGKEKKWIELSDYEIK